MPLNLYRRHRRDCESGRAENSTTGEFTERQRNFGKRCDCTIFISGTLNGKFSRKRSGLSAWDEARRVAEAFEAAGSWNGTVAPPLPEPPTPTEPTRVTLDEAIKVYLTNRETANVAPATLRKYKTFTKQLQTFAAARGYVMLDQFTTADIDVFYSTSKLGIRAKGKLLDTLRTFWKFCVNRALIAASPVSSDLKPPIGANRAANKVPFTDEQLADIIKACDLLEDQRWGNRHGAGIWTGDDVKDFIWLMTYTGLRISDVVLFDMDRVHGNEVFLRAKKNGGDVFTYIPDWLRDRLRERAKRFGNTPFMNGGSKRLDTVIENWRTRIGKAFDLADVGTEKATPHRFRHTFARILLEKGVAVSAVADLMGDDEKTIRQHYSRWVPERQAALTAILKDAFSDKPKLVGIKGGKAG